MFHFFNHSSLPGSLRTRNSAPPTKHLDLTATDVQGNPLPPPPPDTTDQEYMSLVAEGIYDRGMQLKQLLKSPYVTYIKMFNSNSV